MLTADWAAGSKTANTKSAWWSVACAKRDVSTTPTSRMAGPIIPMLELLAAYDVRPYDPLLTDHDWTQAETDYLVRTYRECNGKWPLVIDAYDYPSSSRTMEDLKHRLYTVAAKLLALDTPITSMTAPQYELYTTLSTFDPLKEASRKKLAEGHLKRPRNEVDEETVLLRELQRIMLQQTTLDADREDLRRRLDHPHANTHGYQYTTSQALTGLWQQLLAAQRKTQHLRPPVRRETATTHQDTPTTTDTPMRDAQQPTEQPRFGVIVAADKLPSGITFASDRLSKPRIAKSALQTEKIAAILSHIGVPDLIPLPTPAVIEEFDKIMAKVHTLLDLRKVADREEQEIRTREAEMAA